MVINKKPDTKRKYQHELLSSVDLGVIEDMIVLLEPFYEVFKLLSASTYVTSSINLPAVTRLLGCLQIYESKNGNSFIQFYLAIKMHDNLEDRSSIYFQNNIFLAATFLIQDIGL